MGFKTIRTSDLTGADLPDDQVVTVVVKTHPDLAEGKVFDASSVELSGLKTVDNLVELELRAANGTSRQVLVTKAEFSKIVSDDKLDGFDSVRGRRTGYRPNGS
jgi:hypothetical protein